MALFSSVLRQLFECFTHFLRRRDAPQQCAAQESMAVEKLPEEREAFDGTANDRKCRKRRCKVPEKFPLGEREEERELMEGGSELREAGEKKRKLGKWKEPTPLLVVVKPLHTTVGSSFLKPIEEELPMLPSVSGHLALPAARFKPLPPVSQSPVHPQKQDPAPEDVSLPCSPLQVDPPKLLAVPSCSDEVVSLQRFSSEMLPVVVPPRPTPAPDELFSIRCSSSQVRHPRRLPPSPTSAPDEVVALQRPPSRKPLPFACSPFEPPSELMLVDIEDEESEYVEFTGKTFWASDLLKSERPLRPESEMKPRKMVAWMEKDCEVQEEVWASEVVEVQEFVEEEGDPSEMGDSKAIQGHLDDASQIDERVASPDGPKNETQHNANVQKKCKRQVPLVLFTWAAKKAKKMQEKKIIKEKERREKELLLERYMNDPKMKHLWINKHNRNYCSS